VAIAVGVTVGVFVLAAIFILVRAQKKKAAARREEADSEHIASAVPYQSVA
jgi:hypothetical protein